MSAGGRGAERGRTPGIRGGMGRTIGLVARAGGAWFYAVIVAMSVTGLGFAVELFLGRALVGRLTGPDGPSGTTGTWLLLGGAVLVAAGIAFGQLASTGLHRLLAEKVIYWCNEQVVRLTAECETREFDSPDFHDRIRRARNGAQSSITIALAAPQLVASAVTSLGLLAAVGATAPVLIPIALLSGVPLLIAGRANAREMYSFSFGNTPNDRERFQLEEVLGSRDQAAEVRVFGIEDFLVRRWKVLYDERIAGLTVLVRNFLRRSLLAAAGAAISLVLTLGSLVWLLTTHHINVLAAATAAVSVILLADQAQRMAGNVGQLREETVQVADFYSTTLLLAPPLLRCGRASSVTTLLLAPPLLRCGRASSVATRTAARQLPVRPAGARLLHMRVDGVTFTYPSAGMPALRDVTFDLAADEMVAIVGHNGSGKTTLAKLVCGLYEADAGVVTWNGRPIREQDVGRQLGAVFQTFARYWFSARDNIAVGAVADGLEPDQAKVEAAAREAGAHGFLASLPQGYDTRLAVELDGGTDLSLGQWQRVAIARVLYRQPSFVVLDEPTASLDAEAEAELFETLARLRGGRTVVMISHRFSTVRSADRILVLEQGRLIEQGSHEQLMALGGSYARMYSVQAAAFV
jgi:ATP-binding cassette subfamily B protein